MIELYILVTLGAVGYIMNAATSKKAGVQSYKVSKHNIPSVTSAHADAAAAKKAARMYDRSKAPVKTGVISKNFAIEKDEHMAKKVRLLTGEYVDRSEFVHSNPTPYFGGRIRQNLDPDANSTRLEMFTGTGEGALYKQKCEVGSFFDTTKNVGNVNGLGNKDDFYKDRMVAPRVRNNETPFDKVMVGPGVNKGYSAAPSGGYQQFDMQDIVMPKCVDELRVANKPKMTFEGRTVDGMKAKMRGDVGVFEKNRPDRFYEQTSDHYFRTTGARLKPTEIPEFNVKATHRIDTTTEYAGIATHAGAKRRAAEPGVKQTSRYQLGEFGLRNTALQWTGKGERDDYGKSKIHVYANERDITTTRVYQGNLTSLVKAIVAPVADLLKDTKKEEFVDNPRHFGNMSAQMPEKPAVYDPNDVARATIKETTIHESINGNLKGNEKLTIYDPNDVARTTIKETLVHDDTDRGTLTGPKQLFVYDPDEVAKTTGRETLEAMDHTMNMAGGARKGTIYDPDDVTKTTMKETLVDRVRDGNIDRMEGTGDYNTTDYDPRLTQKQFLSDSDYYGAAGHDMGEGYVTNEHSAKNTQKQFLSDGDYYGAAAASTDKKQKSYVDMYNAYISASQESLLDGRAPTTSGAKTYITGDSISLGHRKQEASAVVLNNVERVASTISAADEAGFTRFKKHYGVDDRLDPSLLKAYHDNPYTKPLNSVA